jgi:hypothetical protein
MEALAPTRGDAARAPFDHKLNDVALPLMTLDNPSSFQGLEMGDQILHDPTRQCSQSERFHGQHPFHAM